MATDANYCRTCHRYDLMGFGQLCPCTHINGTCTTMMPPTKDQSDIGQDNITLDASDREGNKDRARQEGKEEADINYMLSRFGVTQPRGTPTYGEWDDTLDLHTAMDATRETRQAYRKLPAVLRNKFPSMERMLKAIEDGSLVLSAEDAPKTPRSEKDIMQERLDKLEAAAKITPTSTETK